MLHPNEVPFTIQNIREVRALRHEAQKLGAAHCEAFNLQMERQISRAGGE